MRNEKIYLYSINTCNGCRKPCRMRKYHMNCIFLHRACMDLAWLMEKMIWVWIFLILHIGESSVRSGWKTLVFRNLRQKWWKTVALCGINGSLYRKKSHPYTLFWRAMFFWGKGWVLCLKISVLRTGKFPVLFGVGDRTAVFENCGEFKEEKVCPHIYPMVK